MDMDRRQFLQAALLPLVIPQETPPDLGRVTITKVTGFTHVATRPREVGPDARNDARGRTIAEGVLRIETDLGFEGIGFGDSRPELAKGLIGHSLDEFWRPRIGFVSPLGRSDHALYDLMGKALNVPTWKLLGGAGPSGCRPATAACTSTTCCPSPATGASPACSTTSRRASRRATAPS